MLQNKKVAVKRKNLGQNDPTVWHGRVLNVINTFCFLDDILIVTVGSVAKHEMVEEVMKLVDAEGFSLKLKK